MKKGTLYMIPCPVSDTEVYDVIPQHNKEIIQRIDHYVVENLRSARRFLSAAGIGKPIDSLIFNELNEHTSPQDVGGLIAPLLDGHDMGMLSEAGIPGIADPGAELAMLCHKNSIRVVPLVGPSSIFLALAASGMNGQSFAFNGYLPVKPPERGRSIKYFEKKARTENQTQIFIEAPYRNAKLFAEFLSTCSAETMLCVACDITGKDEFIRTAAISVWKKMPAPDINKRPAIFILL